MSKTLLKWTNDEREKIYRFADWWKGKNADDAMEFPLDMVPDEWVQEYRAWQDNDVMSRAGWAQ